MAFWTAPSSSSVTVPGPFVHCSDEGGDSSDDGSKDGSAPDKAIYMTAGTGTAWPPCVQGQVVMAMTKKGVGPPTGPTPKPRGGAPVNVEMQR